MIAAIAKELRHPLRQVLPVLLHGNFPQVMSISGLSNLRACFWSFMFMGVVGVERVTLSREAGPDMPPLTSEVVVIS